MFKQIVSFLALLAYANADCGDITLDSCGVGIAPPFEQTKGLTLQLCEKFCNVIYEDTCNSFTYNKKDSTCELYAAEALDFAKSCAVVGGSVDVDPAECQQLTTPDCNVSCYSKIDLQDLPHFLNYFSCIPRDTVLTKENTWRKF